MTELGKMDFPRDRWGRPLIDVPGETKPQPYTRISSFGSVLENQFGLNKWKMRTMLRGALDRPDLRAIAESKIDDDRHLDNIVEQLIEHGGGSRAANVGTAIHEVLSQINMGTLDPDNAPTDFRPHVRAWLDAVQAHGFIVDPELVECHLVNDEFRAAGSGDVFLRRADGSLVACDIKTGKKIDPRPIAYMVQLYLYSSSSRYDVFSKARQPLGNVDTAVALIAHIPAEGATCTFYEVDLGDARQLTILAAQVKEAEKGGATVRAIGAEHGTDTTVERTPTASPSVGGAPVVARIEWLRERLRTIIATDPGIVQRISGIWPDNVPYLKEGGHSDTQCDAIAHLFDKLEADLGIPFGPSDPTRKTTGVRKSKTDEQKLLDAFPDAVLVDDDSIPTDVEMADLKAKMAALSPDQREWVNRLNDAATAAKASMSLKVKRTRGRAERVLAMLACVDFAEEADAVGTLLRTVTGDDQHIPDFGRVFGTLTISQAQRLQRIAANIDKGTATFVFDGDTCVGVSGDIA